jgi:hypothetical protein
MDTSRFQVCDGVARLDTKYGPLLMSAEDLYLLEGVYIKYKPQCYTTYADLYRRICIGRKRINERVGYLHRLILNAPRSMDVDHANRNGLDNRRSNIRLATGAENGRNRTANRDRKHSPYKGVTWHDCKKYWPNASGDKPWRAYAKVAGRRVWLGYYATAEQAALAYNDYARSHFGEFARLNDVPVTGSPANV